MVNAKLTDDPVEWRLHRVRAEAQHSTTPVVRGTDRIACVCVRKPGARRAGEIRRNLRPASSEFHDFVDAGIDTGNNNGIAGSRLEKTVSRPIRRGRSRTSRS